jgi:hypothetical protein
MTKVGDMVQVEAFEPGANAGEFPVTGIKGKLMELGLTKFTRPLDSQRDKLGQPVNIGDDIVATYMFGRSHYFVRAKVRDMTAQFAVLQNGRKVRFYNTLVVNAIVRQPQGGVSTAELMADG